ncbi:MAG: hypothetical protein AAFU33_00630 [Bacteroidota bacterium]
MQANIKYFAWGLCCLFFMFSHLHAQDEEKPKKFVANGYVKYLHNTNFFDLNGNSLSTNLIHHRLNLKYYFSDKLSLAVDTRNRIFWGEQLKLDTTFADQIDQYNGIVDLSARWVDTRGLYLHSIIDRAYLDYTSGNWEVRVGRQRINWGLNLIWNPNDWFNALNFLDFDYEERPGSDAVRVQYYTGMLSHLEIAYAQYDSSQVAAALYKFNTKGYDIQTLAGYYRGDLAVGVGWEGNIKDAGFKGEISYFYPLEDLSPDTTQSVQASLSADYVFGNGMYLSGGLLYNSNGRQQGGGNGSEITNNALASSALSPKNLFPAEWAFSANLSHQVTPLTSVNLSVLYAPVAAIPPLIDRHLTLALPTVTHAIKENWDLDAVAQVFMGGGNGRFGHLYTGFFLRLKWSY